MLHIFRRKKLVINHSRYVHGDVFTPGAMAFSYQPSVADPMFETDVSTWRNFTSLPAYTAHPLAVQNFVLPEATNPGDPYTVPVPNGLLSLAAAYDASNIPSDIYG